MAYDNHAFCWHGVISPDTKAASGFYSDTLGWEVQTMPMGEGEATMFAADGVPRLHLSEPAEPGVPAHWDNYFRVEDVDAATEAAVANGGARLVPPTDIPVGRFSVVTSPSGAVLHLFHENDSSASNPPQTNGGVHWVELHSHELEADLAWLSATFGITTEEMPMPDGPYTLLRHGEQLIGGAMTAKQQGAPSMWLTWIRVADVEAVKGRVEANGGALHTPIMDAEGVGRMVIAADPTGGVFGIIQPSEA